MNERRKFPFLLVLSLLTSILIIALYLGARNGVQDRLAEYFLNRGTQDLFQGTVRISGLSLDRRFYVHLDRFQGTLASESGNIPIEMGPLVSTGPVWEVFSENGLTLNFQKFRPSKTLREGIRGLCRIKAGRDWFFELKAEVVSLGLEDIEWFNPDALSGSAGEMRGSITLQTNALEEPKISADIHIAEPGGQMQSRFFDTLTPYLPQAKSKKQIQDLAAHKGLVDFRNADLKIELKSTDNIKVFLHVLVPDYNLNLNLNIEIRIDEKNALLQIAQIMGLVKIKVETS